LIVKPLIFQIATNVQKFKATTLSSCNVSAC